jgi:cysteine-rich repeat protein
VAAAPVDVFILAGQSDAVGFGSNAADLPPELFAPRPDIPFWFAEGPIFALAFEVFWITSGSAFVPLGFQSDPSGFTFNGPVDGYGCEITLGRALADSRPVAVVKVAVNGAGLAADWNPAAPRSLYPRLMNEVAGAQAALAASGDVGKIAGFFWVQGATDAGAAASASAYEDNLTSFIQRLRADFGAQDLPFLLARLSINTSLPFLGVVRAAQMNVANAVADTAIVDTDDLPLLADNSHLSGAAQLMLGQRFADAYLALPACGNHVVDPGEECDDGNEVAGDGCAPDCRVEPLPVSGKALLVKDRVDDPSRRRLVLVSKDTTGVVAGPGDPTAGGATLTVTSPAGGVLGSVLLPASRWRAVAPGSFEYADAKRQDGPCKKAVARPGRLEADCAGDLVPISLAQSPQGSLDAVLQLGTGSPVTRYCLRFGGTVARDTAATATKTGTFRARNAPASVGCGS